MFENNSESNTTLTQEIARLKRDIQWTYQIEEADGLMHESSGYLPAQELERDQALASEVLHSIPTEDRTYWRAVREEIVSEHLKTGRSTDQIVVNAELAHRVTRHYPSHDIDASISLMRQSTLEEISQRHQQLAKQHMAMGQAVQSPSGQYGFGGPSL